MTVIFFFKKQYLQELKLEKEKIKGLEEDLKK